MSKPGTWCDNIIQQAMANTIIVVLIHLKQHSYWVLPSRYVKGQYLLDALINGLHRVSITYSPTVSDRTIKIETNWSAERDSYQSNTFY